MMTSRTPPRGAGPGPIAGGAAQALPAWMAFVVQFRQPRAGAGRDFSGRIEHLHSGSRLSFASREDLVAALDRLLDEVAGAVGTEAKP